MATVEILFYVLTNNGFNEISEKLVIPEAKFGEYSRYSSKL